MAVSPSLLQCEALAVSRPRVKARRLVFEGLSLRLSAGEVSLLSGPSGCGKSTLLFALARLLPLAEGRLFLEGRPAEAVAAHEWRTKVGLLPQSPALIPGSVRDNLLLPWRLRVRAHSSPPGDASLQEALGTIGLAGVTLSTPGVELSGGEQARVAFLRLLLPKPRVLLLDEPTSQLDDASAGLLAERVAVFTAAGGAVLLVQHDRRSPPHARELRFAEGRLEEEAA